MLRRILEWLEWLLSEDPELEQREREAIELGLVEAHWWIL